MRRFIIACGEVEDNACTQTKICRTGDLLVYEIQPSYFILAGVLESTGIKFGS